MDIATIEQIILMVGQATDSAVTIAILWMVGGYLMSIVGYGVTIYVIKLIVERFCSYLNCDVRKEDFEALVDRNKKLDQDNGLLWEKHNSRIEVLKAEHKIELERIKHLYKILKESKGNV